MPKIINKIYVSKQKTTNANSPQKLKNKKTISMLSVLFLLYFICGCWFHLCVTNPGFNSFYFSCSVGYQVDLGRSFPFSFKDSKFQVTAYTESPSWYNLSIIFATSLFYLCDRERLLAIQKIHLPTPGDFCPGDSEKRIWQ